MVYRSWPPAIDCAAQFRARVSALPCFVLLCSLEPEVSVLIWHSRFLDSVGLPSYPFEIAWRLHSRTHGLRTTFYDLRLHNLHGHPRLHDASPLLKMPTYISIIYYATSSIIPSYRSCTRNTVHTSTPTPCSRLKTSTGRRGRDSEWRKKDA